MRSRLGPPGISTVTAISLADATKNDAITIAGDADAFVRSHDTNGDLRWTRQFGTSVYDIANRIATDADGNVYIAGTTLGDLDGANAGSLDAFVRALAP